MGWTADDIPDLTGRTYLVTGANSGIGFEAARALVRRGARVVLACRSPEKAGVALDALRKESPGAEVAARRLDLASLASVRAFAEQTLEEEGALHGLLNNAGVMALPYGKTEDGFEMQLGTNHLGHFALTGLLLERLLETPGSRVVSVSSTAHAVGRMRWDDLHWEQSYRKWSAYAQSKLANLLFTHELQRRFEAKGAGTRAAACHPGYAATNLQTAGPKAMGAGLRAQGMTLMNVLFAQSAEMGALPTLYAACAPDVAGADYIGPGGLAGTRGHPKKTRASARAYDPEAQARLWDVSEAATGVRYTPLA
jgi:NAD(P)-dependent dehydrogenase (short-subunit alcohol dehydrogenase family)